VVAVTRTSFITLTLTVMMTVPLTLHAVAGLGVGKAKRPTSETAKVAGCSYLRIQSDCHHRSRCDCVAVRTLKQRLLAV